MYLPHFTEEVLKRILAAMFADRQAFTETLQWHKEDFSSLLQHMADCYKALFAKKSSCTSTSVAIKHLVNEFKSIHSLRKTMFMHFYAAAMLMGDALLCHHFRKGMYHGGIGSCTLLSLMYSCYSIKQNTK